MPEPGIVPHGTPPSPGSIAQATARGLVLQLWLTSMLCWWVIGITFPRLWWLVNASQLRWILFCCAWEVPAVGWTGAVLLPYLGFRRVQRRLEAGDPDVGRALARYPMQVALLVIGTSSVLQRTPRPVLEKPLELSTLAALVKQVAGERVIVGG